MTKLSIQEAGAQIAKLPWAKLVGVVFTYSGVPAFPRMRREKPSVYSEGTGAEISTILLGQEVTVYSKNGVSATEKLQSLDGKVEVEQMLQGDSLKFSVKVDVVDPRYRRWFFLPARMTHYSYTVSGTIISI